MNNLELLAQGLREIKVDQQFIGIKFLWNGRTTEGIDCIGLVWLFLKESGIILTDNDGKTYDDNWRTEEPQRLIKGLLCVGKKIDAIENLEPLDIIVFRIKDKVSHIGIYVGYGKFLHIHANANSSIGRLRGLWEQFFYCGIRPTDLCHNNIELYEKIKDEKIGDPISGAIAIVASWLATAGAAVGVTGTGMAVFAATVIVYGAMAAASYGIQLALAPKAPKPNFGEGGSAEGSVRYSFGPLSSQASSELPIPIAYGQMKLSGNCIYQSDPDTTISRCDVFCEGQISSISDIRVNDVPIGELTGCSVTTYLGTSSQSVDGRFSNRVPGLRNLAYLALTLATSDKLMGGFPTITLLADCLLVETWDGNKWITTKSFSRNPSACVRDFLINIRYGAGLPKNILDEESFGEVYDYNNALVNNNSGGTEVRHQLDYVIDAKKPIVDILGDMLSTFGGYLVWSGNRLRLKVEKIGNVVQNFNMSNIVEKSFSYQYVSKDDMLNRVKVLYISPNENYTKVFTLAEDKLAQDDRAALEGGSGVLEREISALGVTRFSQASRLANMAIKISKACPILCTFRAGIYAIHCEPGDIISVSHDVPAWTNKLFRIYGVSEQDNDEVQLTCKEYNASVYDDSYGSGITAYQYGSPPNYLKNSAEISNLSLSEIGWRNTDGTHVASIDALWTEPVAKDYLTGYYVEWSKDGGAYEYVARAEMGSSYLRIPNATVGSLYVIRIKSVNYYGIYSTGVTSSSIDIVGKDIPPPDVTGFIVNQYRDSLVFSWDKITSIQDLHHFEIKEGASWEIGKSIANLVTGNDYTFGDIKEGTTTFWIKSVDNSGNYSTNAVGYSVTVTNIPFKNIIFTQNEHTAWTARYEGDVEPDSDGWTLSGTDFSSVSGGILTINNDGTATGFYLRDWTGDNATGWTLETRVKVVSVATPNQDTRILHGADGTMLEVVRIEAGKVILYSSGSLFEYAMDTTDAFHIYRLTVAGSVSKLYVDNVLRITGTPLANAQDSIRFGNVSENAGCNIQIDYWYWDENGASASAWAGAKNNLTVAGTALEIDVGYLSGDYLTDWINIGKATTARVAFQTSSVISGDLAFDSDATLAFDTYDNLRFTGFDVTPVVDFYIQTSGDSGPSGDLVPWQFSDYVFRYVRAKVVLQRSDVNQTTNLSTLTVNIDVPDIDEFDYDIFVPSTGKAITFTNDFFDVPAVSISVKSSGDVIRTPVISSKTVDGFTVTLLDLLSNGIQGNIDYHAHGF